MFFFIVVLHEISYCTHERILLLDNLRKMRERERKIAAVFIYFQYNNNRSYFTHIIGSVTHTHIVKTLIFRLSISALFFLHIFLQQNKKMLENKKLSNNNNNLKSSIRKYTLKIINSTMK